MDINLTGALVANVSLMQSPKTDYLPLYTQIWTTILTAGVTLGGVYLAQYLASKSEAGKRANEEKEKYYHEKKRAYQEFLSEFSEPILVSNIYEFKKVTGSYLNTAMNLAKFGNIRLTSPIANDLDNPQYPTLLTQEYDGQIEERPLWTLEDFIEAILNTRLWKIDDQLGYLNAIRSIGSENFGPLLLSVLMTERTEERPEKAKAKRWWRFWRRD
jgi:hypothetical protein